MADKIELLLTMSRKSFMGADFRHAIECAEEVKAVSEGRAWLEAQKWIFSSARELQEGPRMAQVHSELQAFLKKAPEEFKALAHYILAQSYSLRGEWPIVKGHSEAALAAALANNNHHDLALAFFALVRVASFQGDFVRAQEILAKLDTLLEVHSKEELKVSVLLQKAQLAMLHKQFEMAIQYCWQGYEHAKMAGLFVYIPMVLGFLASLHVEKGAVDEGRSYLTLAEKGISPSAQPYLWEFLKGVRRRFENIAPVKNTVDLVVDVGSKSIFEKSKGAIDFKNQHTLLELALLLLRHPHTPFSKEQLMEKVWGRVYDPSIHDNLIYVTVKRLRSLIEPDPGHPQYILRNRQGYYFNDRASFTINEGSSE